MEKPQSYEQLITAGIKGLPQELLAEIADFVYFVRKRVTQPQDHRQELQAVLLEQDLDTLHKSEWAHLEKEFLDYDRKFPQD